MNDRQLHDPSGVMQLDSHVLPDTTPSPEHQTQRGCVAAPGHPSNDDARAGRYRERMVALGWV